ncbi:MAG TPA: maltose O-acetyltransferase [Ligilactobacillus acidipiscis]|uniref:Acetyltransferase n=1 Tax=Ligilactobacillus acidipiscis TaxID=89059 RepID=A0A921FC93_9LACO|nr:maltose O-acetyltransferase [Ligilactobacillus acidipiscis]
MAREKFIKNVKCDPSNEDVKLLLQQLNSIEGHCEQKKENVIAQLFGRVGDSAVIEPDFDCKFGCNISVGRNFNCSSDCSFVDEHTISIGDNCFLAPLVTLDTSKQNGECESSSIIIGDDVWLGCNSEIDAGVTLGNNVVVSANSTITKSFGDNVILAGSPAKIIGKNNRKNLLTDEIFSEFRSM